MQTMPFLFSIPSQVFPSLHPGLNPSVTHLLLTLLPPSAAALLASLFFLENKHAPTSWPLYPLFLYLEHPFLRCPLDSLSLTSSLGSNTILLVGPTLNTPHKTPASISPSPTTPPPYTLLYFFHKIWYVIYLLIYLPMVYLPQLESEAPWEQGWWLENCFIPSNYSSYRHRYSSYWR